MFDGDHRTHHVQHHQLVQTVHEKGDDIAGDHLAALGHVEHLSAEKAQQHGDRNGNDHGQHHAGNPPDLPVRGKDQSDLPGHGAQGHTEVQTHAGHDGDQQAEDQKRVPAHSGENLVDQIPRREAGYRYADGADQDKHDRH